MAWAKLDNPKPPAATALAPDRFRITARDAPVRKSGATKPSRYITVKLGKLLCERASMLQKEHRVHIMKGSGDDSGKVAVVLDDSAGKFAAKRKADGRYEINIGEHAAKGQFAMVFAPFGGVGTLMRLSGTAPVITLDVPPEFLQPS